MMLSLLLYAYATGVSSSRQIERCCEVDVAFKVIAPMKVPDHCTIAEFRRRHQDAIGEVFVQVLALCAEAGLVGVGVIAIDGTKIQANASRDCTRSYVSIVEELLADAEAADREEDERHGSDRGDEPPAGWRSRGERRQALADAAEAGGLGWRPRAFCSSRGVEPFTQWRELLTQREERRVLGMVGANVRALDREHPTGDVKQPGAERARTFGDLSQLADQVSTAVVARPRLTIADVAVGRVTTRRSSSRERRHTPVSTATCACNSGPNALGDTPAGSRASAGLSQSGHSSRSRRHSRTPGTTNGSCHC